VAAAPASNGSALFGQRCAGCHSGSGRAPAQAALAMRAPGDIVAALTTGAMAAQGRSLSDADKRAIAQFLTGRAP
jgi:polyvinyl alcohol dehydrogenase (cytochrome)